MEGSYMRRTSTVLFQIMTDSAAFVYPKPRRDDAAMDEYHGTKVNTRCCPIPLNQIFRWQTHTNGWRIQTALKRRNLWPSKMPSPNHTSTLARFRHELGYNCFLSTFNNPLSTSTSGCFHLSLSIFELLDSQLTTSKCIPMKFLCQ